EVVLVAETFGPGDHSVHVACGAGVVLDVEGLAVRLWGLRERADRQERQACYHEQDATSGCHGDLLPVASATDRGPLPASLSLREGAANRKNAALGWCTFKSPNDEGPT